jgi:hypothetical protein
MSVYEYNTDSDGFDSLIFAEKDGALKIVDLPDRIPGSPWTPPMMEVWREKRRGDFLSIALSVPVMTREAWRIIAPLVQDDVEPLELRSSDGEFLLLNVTRVVDCLDEARSRVTRFTSGKVMRIESFAFTNAVPHERGLFRIPQLRSDTFVTERFRSLVETARLTGLLFKPLPRDN